MLVPAPVRRVNVFLREADVELATIALGQLGQLHLQSGEEEGQSAHDSYWGGLADTYNEQAQRAQGLAQTLALTQRPVPPSEHIAPSRDSGHIAEALREAEQAVRDWEGRSKKAQQDIEHLGYLAHEAHLLAPLDMPVENIRDPEYLHWVVGTMPRENLEVLTAALFHRRHERPSRRAGMREVSVFVPELQIERATVALVGLEDFHLGTAKGGSWAEESPYWQQMADTSTDQAQRMEDMLAALNIAHPARAPWREVAPSREVNELSAQIADAEAVVEDWRERRRQKQREIRHLQDLAQGLNTLAQLNAPVEDLRNPQYLHWSIGTIPSENLDNLRVSLFRIPAVVVPITTNGGRSLVLAATTPHYSDVLDTAMNAVFLQPVELPQDVSGTPEEALREIKGRLDRAQGELVELDDERQRLAQQWRETLLALWQRASSSSRVTQAITRCARHGHTFLVSGWTPEVKVEDVLSTLETVTDREAEVETVGPGEPSQQGPLEVMLFRLPFVIVPVGLEHERVLIFAATVPGYADVLDRVMGGVFMEPVPLPEDLRGVPSQVLPQIESRLADARGALMRLTEERKHLAQCFGGTVLSLWGKLLSNLRVARAISSFVRRKDTILISGWVLESAVGQLVNKMRSATGGRVDVELVKPQLGGRRRPPTYLRNPRILRPFEAIVRTFGYPDYHEIDPTPLTAISFTLMYGIMFGDVGHGLLLASLGLMVQYRATGGLGSLGPVLVASGLCASVFGALYGSLFGREDIIPSLWLSPLSSIMDLLIASVVAGIVLLTIGFLLSLVRMVRTRDWGRLLFSRSGVAGMWLYWSLVGGGYAAVKGALPPSVLVGLILVPGALLVFYEPLGHLVTGQHPLGGKGSSLVQSAFELFETLIGYFSNTLSFVRLGAFAVAHAAFMAVIFGLADVSGSVLRWPVIVLGTVLVVGFEGLVVGIQALRLEYYEFFTRFFEGNGSPFKPFRLFGTEESQV